MVDALNHGTPAAAGQAQDMVGRGVGQAIPDAQPGERKHCSSALIRIPGGGIVSVA